MRLALETATDRASVALGTSAADALERELAGARRQAAGLLPMIDAVLREAGATLDDVTALVLSDGPGSFTGLRVGAAVAKALVQARGFPLWIAPSLMVRARGVSHPGSSRSVTRSSSAACSAARSEQSDCMSILRSCLLLV